jgi:hypothetical protein
MKKINEKLSEILDIEPITIEEPVVTSTELVEVETKPVTNVVESDTEYARSNIKDLIDKGADAIKELAVVARDSQHPRAYEVMAGMLKNLSDMNKDLLEIQKRKQDLTGVKTNPSNDVNIDKAVFVGSTAELMKLLKSEK